MSTFSHSEYVRSRSLSTVTVLLWITSEASDFGTNSLSPGNPTQESQAQCTIVSSLAKRSYLVVKAMPFLPLRARIRPLRAIC